MGEGKRKEVQCMGAFLCSIKEGGLQGGSFSNCVSEIGTFRPVPSDIPEINQQIFTKGKEARQN